MKSITLEQQIEALLFVSGRPLTAVELASYTQSTERAVTQALMALQTRLSFGGTVIVAMDKHYELASHPAARKFIEAFQNSEFRSELSKPALETLAIIAYKQPITRSGLEEIRGVSSEQILKNLILRGLVVEAGKSSEPGKPTLYATSHSFMRHFGLTKPDELPPIESFEHDKNAA